MQDQTDNIDNEDKVILNLNPQKLFILTTIPKNSILTTITIVQVTQDEIYNIDFDESDLKPFESESTETLIQSMTICKTLKP